MLIESIIHRENGTRPTLGDTTYHFKPSGNDPRHLAEVTDEDHIQTFLAIKEGYRIAKVAPKAAAPIAAPAPAARVSSRAAPSNTAEPGAKVAGTEAPAAPKAKPETKAEGEQTAAGKLVQS